MEDLGDHRCKSSLVLTIQLLGYLILTRTQIFSNLIKSHQMGVPINGGTPQGWMDYNGKSHYLMDDLGVPPFQETSKYDQSMDWFKDV